VQVLLAHRPDVKLISASVGKNWLVLNERSNALKTVAVHKLPAGAVIPSELSQAIKVDFDEPAYDLSGGESCCQPTRRSCCQPTRRQAGLLGLLLLGSLLLVLSKHMLC